MIRVGGKAFPFEGFGGGVEIGFHARVKYADIISTDIINANALGALVEIVQLGFYPAQTNRGPDHRRSVSKRQDKQHRDNGIEHHPDPEADIKNGHQNAHRQANKPGGQLKQCFKQAI